jgi:hypothetical protein
MKHVEKLLGFNIMYIIYIKYIIYIYACMYKGIVFKVCVFGTSKSAVFATILQINHNIHTYCTYVITKFLHKISKYDTLLTFPHPYIYIHLHCKKLITVLNILIFKRTFFERD